MPCQRIELPTATRTCGECSECCIAYPLLPNEQYWPEGKQAHVPCKHLCEGGCGIYQDRPAVCAGFACGYLNGCVPQRPDENGVILWTQDLWHAFRCGLAEMQFQGRVPDAWREDDLVIAAAECRPGALLALDPQRIRWWYKREEWRAMVAVPYGFDLLNSKSGALRYYPGETIAVWWEGSPDYAERLIKWWHGAAA